MGAITSLDSLCRAPRRGEVFAWRGRDGEVLHLKFAEEWPFDPDGIDGCVGCLFLDASPRYCPRFIDADLGRRRGGLMCVSHGKSPGGVWIEVDPLEVDLRMALGERDGTTREKRHKEELS